MNDNEFRGFIEQVRSKADIFEVISQHLEINRHNKALCPFHEEKTPSFSINPDGQFFFCFGCGTGGDVFRFVELIENKSFWETVLDLAGKACIPIPDIKDNDRDAIEEMRNIEGVIEETAKFYQKSMAPAVKQYLIDERQISAESILYFRIGYAKGGLREWLLKEKKYPLEICLKAGVLKEDSSGTIKDFFYERIILTTLFLGRAVYLTGRSVGDHPVKYLNLPGKIEYLFNEDVLSQKTVYIAEGIVDCITANQNGFPSAAILGSPNFKPGFLSKFDRCDRIYLCLDGDSAGEQGALESAKLIGERARIITLPPGTESHPAFHQKN